MAIANLASNFTLGQLSPRLLARTDFQGYYKGAREITNMLPTPQGGVKRRWGTTWLGQIPGITSANQVRLATLEYFTNQIYSIVFAPLTVYIFGQSGAAPIIVSSPYTEEDIPDLRWTQTDSELLVFHEDHPPAILSRNNFLPPDWSLNNATFTYFPVNDFTQNYNSITFTPNPTAVNDTTTITASSAIFSTAYIGGMFAGNGGVVRLTGFTDSTHMTGIVIVAFIDGSGILGSNAELAEPAFSADRGWPKTASFYQNRLVLGGSTSLPQGVWLSKINDFFNFDTTQTFDNYAIGVYVRSDRSNVVQHVMGGQSLFIFTTRGVFADKAAFGEPITPTNPSLLQQTAFGASNVFPVNMDNQIVYVDYGGVIVRSLQYDVVRQNFGATNISVLSPELIRNPVDGASYQNPSIDDGNYFFMVNSDGTLSAYMSLIAQNVNAWSLQVTDGANGQFCHVDGSLSQTFFITQRTINEEIVFYLESLDYTTYMDCTTSFNFETPQTVITGLYSLEGEEVQIRTDGYVITPQIVNNGQITLELAASNVQVGLRFTPVLTPMPVTIESYSGPDLYNPKKTQYLYVDYIDSLGIKIKDANDNLIYSLFEQEFDDITLDTAPVPQTGYQKVPILQGWDPRYVIKITQDEPLPMEIIGILQEVGGDFEFYPTPAQTDPNHRGLAL